MLRESQDYRNEIDAPMKDGFQWLGAEKGFTMGGPLKRAFFDMDTSGQFSS